MNVITVNTNVTTQAIKNWNWEKSVEKIQGLFENKSKKVSKQLIEELISAKENIDSHVGNPHGRYTWKQYCIDCFAGSPTQRTIENWIKNHLKGGTGPKPLKVVKLIDIDSQFITYRKKHSDGTYTVRISVCEYDDLFEETFAA